MNELDVIRKGIRDRMNDIADSIASGACKDIEDYRRMCGVIEGLAYVERDILDLKAQMERNED